MHEPGSLRLLTSATRRACMALAGVVLLACTAHGALVTSVFGGKVPCVVQSGVQFCQGSLANRGESWDGVPLDVNVTIPPATMNGPFPLIVDIHGWGLAKTPNPEQQALDCYAGLSYTARPVH